MTQTSWGVIMQFGQNLMFNSTLKINHCYGFILFQPSYILTFSLLVLAYHSFLMLVSWKLREYVDDTEDYLNIMLDDKQNHLLQMGVLLSTATLVLGMFIVLAGVLGINIRGHFFNDVDKGMPRFLWTIGGGTASCIFLYVSAIVWYKRKRLLEWWRERGH